MLVHSIPVPTHLQRQMVCFMVGSHCWLFTHELYQPSRWLLLKREGFTGDLLTSSQELDSLSLWLGDEELTQLYTMYHGRRPERWFTFMLREDVEDLILSGRIQVFRLASTERHRISNSNDPLMAGKAGFYHANGDPVVIQRNALAEELGGLIAARWIGKDRADRLHWDRNFVHRELVESYDVGKAVVDTGIDFIAGLWDAAVLVLEVHGAYVEAKIRIKGKIARGDIEGLKQELRDLQIFVDDSVQTGEQLIAEAQKGLEIFKQLISDPLSRTLIADFLDSLYQSMKYRDSRTLPVVVVTTVGIEVLIALATAGAGTAARHAATTTAAVARTAARKATDTIGPFTAKAVNIMAELAKSLKKRGVREAAPEAPPPRQRPKPKDNNDGNTRVARTAAQDRAEITKLSKEADEARKAGDNALAAQKIEEARDILRPHLPKNPGDSWDEVLERLDVDSPDNGAVFWSGNQRRAQEYAESIGGTTLEATPGGRILDNWSEVNDLPWDAKKGPPPWSGDLWNGVSQNFANGATGKVSVVQPPEKLWDQGTVWHNSEKKIIMDKLMDGSVTEVEIFTINGNDDLVKLSPNYANDLLQLEGIPR